MKQKHAQISRKSTTGIKNIITSLAFWIDRGNKASRYFWTLAGWLCICSV